jgi:hypothetical protein
MNSAGHPGNIQQMAEPWFAALDAFAREMIPSDDLPGAAEAGTAEAVAAVLRASPGQQVAIAGLEALTRLGFVKMPSPERQEMMTLLARGTPPGGWLPTDPPPATFWRAIRGLTVALFYGSEYGRQVTGFPGPSVDKGGWKHTIIETFDA